MDLFSFGVHFTDEQSCRIHFKEQRDKEGGYLYPLPFWLKNKWIYQCKSCKAWISLRSGTILESSKLSFMTWYKTIFILFQSGKQAVY